MARISGSDAQATTLALRKEHDPAKVRRVREDLWRYCELDTLGMVRIVEAIMRVAERGTPEALGRA